MVLLTSSKTRPRSDLFLVNSTQGIYSLTDMLSIPTSNARMKNTTSSKHEQFALGASVMLLRLRNSIF
uniref:Uncharacterized protein n=1 Tax=Arundo donax TaxID=35708 RepID=A0A0A8ZT15_ARUDO